ncbi:MAG: hypothetical protein LBQ50_06310 [Planctomycetaceae bacterium]|jgi:hypothetical protein|nr:hypothetical protein [Planctomycetaceae bacterium]
MFKFNQIMRGMASVGLSMPTKAPTIRNHRKFSTISSEEHLAQCWKEVGNCLYLALENHDETLEKNND